MKNNKIIYQGIIILACVIFISNSLSGLAFSTKYYEENPLKLYPGQTTNISVDIQNMAGTTTENVKLTITKGQDIAKIIGEDTFPVAVGERKTIQLQISIPSDTQIGGRYDLEIILSNTVEGAPGAGLGSGNKNIIPIFIVNEPKEQKNFPWTYILLILIILIILVSIIIKKKR